MSDTVNKEWYVIHTYSGYENKVKDNLEKRVESLNMEDKIFRIVVPEEKETIITPTGKKKEVNRKTFPGYVLVELVMTDDSWFVVRNTPGVTGFIGSSGGGAKPFPVAPDEMEAILRRIGQSDKKISIDFEIGDTVKILAGPFSGMEGRVASLNDQTQTANVLIMLFGRETPTDINYGDLEKVELF